jgi:hypothetical protein
MTSAEANESSHLSDQSAAIIRSQEFSGKKNGVQYMFTASVGDVSFCLSADFFRSTADVWSGQQGWFYQRLHSWPI